LILLDTSCLIRIKAIQPPCGGCISGGCISGGCITRQRSCLEHSEANLSKQQPKKSTTKNQQPPTSSHPKQTSPQTPIKKNQFRNLGKYRGLLLIADNFDDPISF
jgi:hypothetical protein